MECLIPYTIKGELTTIKEIHIQSKGIKFMKITLSKIQWNQIGIQAGWVKKSNSEFTEYKFHSRGELHRNMLLDTLEEKYGVTFRDYTLSPTGIKANNPKTEQILKNLFDTTPEPVVLNGMTKPKAARIVNNILSSKSKGLFSDTDWSGIANVFKALRANGINYELKSNEYSHNEAGIPSSKTWRFEIEFINDKGRPTTLYGVVVAAGSGSVKDPLDKYDITAYVS
jgi:hypothetical protein